MLSDLAAIQQDLVAQRRARRRAAVLGRLGLGERGALWWAAALVSGAAVAGWAMATRPAMGGDPAAAFPALRALAAVVCAGSGWLGAQSVRRGNAEAATASATVMTVVGSCIALDHSVTMAGAGALLVAAPLVAPPSWARLQRWWRVWVASTVVATALLAVAVMATQRRLTVDGRGLASMLAVVVVAGAWWWSARLLRLHGSSGSSAALCSAIMVGLAGLAWGGAIFEGSSGARFQAFIAVVVATCGIALATFRWTYRVPAEVRSLLEPIERAWPVAVVEIATVPFVVDYARRLAESAPPASDRPVRIATLALAVGKTMGLDDARLHQLALAALLHDIAMLDLPDEVLVRPGGLTDAERELVEHHPVVGADRLAAIPSLRRVAELVRSHHERVDGRGYPDRLAGRRIPLESRIVAACGAYDSLTHENARRGGTGHAWAIAVLRHHAGQQFDAAVVDALAVVTADRGPVVTPPDPEPTPTMARGSVEGAAVLGAAAPTLQPLDAAWALFASDLLREPAHRERDEHRQDHD